MVTYVSSIVFCLQTSKLLLDAHTSWMFHRNRKPSRGSAALSSSLPAQAPSTHLPTMVATAHYLCDLENGTPGDAHRPPLPHGPGSLLGQHAAAFLPANTPASLASLCSHTQLLCPYGCRWSSGSRAPDSSLAPALFSLHLFFPKSLCWPFSTRTS